MAKYIFTLQEGGLVLKLKRIQVTDPEKLKLFAEKLAWDGVITFGAARSLAGRNIDFQLETGYEKFLAIDIFDYFWTYDFGPRSIAEIESEFDAGKRTIRKIMKELVRNNLITSTEDGRYQLTPEIDAESRSLTPLVDKNKVKAHRIQRAKKLAEIFKIQPDNIINFPKKDS